MSEKVKPRAPVHSATVYRRDVVLHKKGLLRAPGRGKEHGDVVHEWTRETRDALTFLAANTDTRWTCLVLLTYGDDFPRDGLVVRKHLNAWLTGLRKAWPGCRYLWVREYQQRDAPHFHILVDIPPGEIRTFYRKERGEHVPCSRFWDAWAQRTWRQTISHDCNLPAGDLIVAWELLRDVDGGGKYMAVYASKMDQKTVPRDVTNPGRWWGASRDVKAKPLGHLKLDDAEVHRIMGGRERSKTGDVYRLLHGAREDFERADAESGIRENRRPRGTVFAKHAANCGCRKCRAGGPEVRVTPDCLREAERQLQDDASTLLWVNWCGYTAPLERCAAQVARSSRASDGTDNMSTKTVASRRPPG